MQNKKTFLVPRFKYTLPTIRYFTSFFKRQSDITFYDQAIFFNTARVALKVLLSSISNGEKLKVGVQAYTCHSVFEAIKRAGHQIVFVDITDDFKLDRHDLLLKVDEIDVLIVSHTFGNADNVDEIKKIIGGKIIIEDCAHAFLSQYKGTYCGLLGDASIFSTGLGKFPAIGDGGFCLINKKDSFPLFDEELSNCSSASIFSSAISFVKSIVLSVLMSPPLYGWLTFPLGKKLDSKVDVIGKFKFVENRGPNWVRKLLFSNSTYYNSLVVKRQVNTKSNHTSHDSTITHNVDEASNHYIYAFLLENRDVVYDHLISSNVEGGKHFHNCVKWAEEYGYVKGDCPNVEIIVSKVLTIPTHKLVKSKLD